MSVVRWEDPPDSRAQLAARWRDAAAELRARPGVWAVLLESDSSKCSALVNYVKRGHGPFAPAPGGGVFEALSRTVHKREGRVAVYARYIGGDDTVNDEEPH